MKKPRVNDFDPDARVPELASPLDAMPFIQKPVHDKVTTLPPMPEPPVRLPHTPLETVRPSVSTPVRTPVRRTITRYAFEFFQDQIESLRRFSLEEKGRGEKGSMSQMIREATDAYIAKRNRMEK